MNQDEQIELDIDRLQLERHFPFLKREPVRECRPDRVEDEWHG